jgi:hypothetical protein
MNVRVKKSLTTWRPQFGLLFIFVSRTHIRFIVPLKITLAPRRRLWKNPLLPSLSFCLVYVPVCLSGTHPLWHYPLTNWMPRKCTRSKPPNIVNPLDSHIGHNIKTTEHLKQFKTGRGSQLGLNQYCTYRSKKRPDKSSNNPSGH